MIYSLFAIAVIVWVQTQIFTMSQELKSVSNAFQARWRQTQVVTLAQDIERFYDEKGVLPASLDALGGTSGFEHTRSARNNWQGFGVSPVLNDGVWQYRRLVLSSSNPTKGVSPSDYLVLNNCGTGDYSTAASWCGQATGRWFRLETRDRYNDQIVIERVRLQRFQQKLADYFSKYNSFPNQDASGGALAANSITSLADLASFSGTALTCGGTFVWMRMPVDCGDMFDLWGGAIGYQFITSKHIVLVSETPLLNNAGATVVVAADADYTNF